MAERLGPGRRAAVFYNPAMALDRDLGVAVLRAWAASRSAPPRGWEMLSATGVRGLRLLSEGPPFSELHLTERSPAAYEVLAANAQNWMGRGARPRGWDSVEPLEAGGFDYVDLDPYGSPAPFLPAALAALRTGGLLAVTATDLPVLAGVQPTACRDRYGARSIRGAYGPEAGLRILLAYIDRGARREGRALIPRLAYVLGHHLRVYGEVAPATSPAPVASVEVDRPDLPALPGAGPYGPLWVGALLDREFVRGLSVPATAARPAELGRLLARFVEESEVPSLFWYEPNRLASAVGRPEPPGLAPLLNALRESGYRAARSHVRPSAFRTDAPREAVAEAVRRLGGEG